jgi:8-oxo-dGTP pyrophosphatase MutT (NUDIX family)
MQKYGNWEVRQLKPVAEYNDIYDENRCLTGKLHLRGTQWQPGEYGLIVCVWVYDGRGHFLLTRRAPGKSFAGTWENSGGAAKAGETSRQAIARELFEETGIQAAEEEFELLASDRDRSFFFDHYCLKRPIRLKDIKLQPGETDDVMWASFGKIHWMIRSGRICKIIGHQFYRLGQQLYLRNFNKNKP